MIRRHPADTRCRPRRSRTVHVLIGSLAAVLVCLGVLPAVAAGTAQAGAHPRPAPHHTVAVAGTARTSTSTSQLDRDRPATHPIPATPVSNTTPAASPAPTPAASATTTRIRLVWGDTLWGLSQHYHTTIGELQALNHLGDSALIYAGQTLLVPAADGTAQSIPQDQTPPAGQPTQKTTTHASVAPTSAQTSSHAGAVAVAFAKAQLGLPYLWGGTGNGGYDCSGLVQAAWRAAEIDLPRTTYDQVHAGRPTTRAALVPGDLVFSDNVGHVQLYIGGSRVIEAPYSGATVHITSLPDPGQVDAYVHVG